MPTCPNMRNPIVPKKDLLLLLIRHGESEADLLKVHEGRADFALTARGHRQAAAMADFVSQHYTIDRLYASPLLRAQQTANHLSSAVGLSPISDADWMEFDNGLLAGLSYAEAKKRYPPIKDLPIDQAVYGQESLVAFRLRAERALTRLFSESAQNETIAVVTHGGMINQIYHVLLGMPIQSGRWFLTGDTGFHVWRFREGESRIELANSTVHLIDIE